jgi:hypothetical protein
LPSTLYKAFSRALAISLATPLIYMFIRGWAWHSTLLVARLFWNIPKASEPSRLPPFHYTLLWRSLVFSVLLVCLWELANSVFDAFVAQEPLKHDNPLTSESLDPNGSLLNGLKSRKETVKVGRIYLMVDSRMLISERYLHSGNCCISASDLKIGGRKSSPTLTVQEGQHGPKLSTHL